MDNGGMKQDRMNDHIYIVPILLPAFWQKLTSDN